MRTFPLGDLKIAHTCFTLSAYAMTVESEGDP